MEPQDTIFLNGRDIPDPAARAAYLTQACGNDAALRQRVEAMLRDAAGAEAFFGREPAVAEVTEGLGTVIGRYKLLQQIGEGGCGVVYLAEQETPVRRQVALKVIKLGMDTKSVIARFEAERQALALMDHPNIAKVLDAGATQTGRPYFVMELVRGVKITDYCDKNNLPTRERLNLFVQVCEAIQHAHQKGIIHRDIKPSNILVMLRDGIPAPKVIDFGIAKATTDQRLTDKTLFTALEQFIGTPAYMSPEQAEMSDAGIDTRSDIYSLGVLLYELLTGQTPFDSNHLLRSGLGEIRRIIREEEPARPSTRLSAMTALDLGAVAKHRQLEPGKLSVLIRGELDWIVMKALEKDRGRRYETASGLAMDVERHLADEPVVARPTSTLYRLQKSIRRNKGFFAAVLLIAAVLLAGVVASTREAVRARRAEREQDRLRAVAESKEKKSEAVAQFLEDMLKGVGPSVALGRDTTMLREIVDKTEARMGTDLKDQPEAEIELRATLTELYRDLYLYPKMAESAKETLRLARVHLGAENPTVADALGQLGTAQMLLRQFDDAERNTREAIAMQRKVRGAGSAEEAKELHNLGDVLRHQAHVYSDPAKLREGEAALRQSLLISTNLPGNDDDEIEWTLYALATLLGNERKSAEAISVQREALALGQKLHGDEHPYTGEAYCQLGALLSDSTDMLAEGVKDLRQGLGILKRTSGERNFSWCWPECQLGNALAKQGQLEEAESDCRAAVTNASAMFGPDYPDLIDFNRSLADVLRQENKLDEADVHYGEALAINARTSGRNNPDRAQYLDDLITLLRQQGKLAEAESYGREALAMNRKQLGDEHPETVISLAGLIGTLFAEDKLAEAEAGLPELVTLRTAVLKAGIKRSDYAIELGHSQWQITEALTKTNRLEQAEESAQAARQIFAQAAGDFPTVPFLRQEQAFSGRLHGDVLEKLGRVDEAESDYRSAVALYAGLKAAEPANAFFWQEEDYTIWMLAGMLGRAGKLDAAEAEDRQAMALQEQASARFPTETDLAERLGEIKADLVGLLISRGKFSEAKLLVAERGNAAELSTLAWSLATIGDPNLPDGTDAIIFAEKAVAATGRTNVSYLDTLSATYAEAGQFAKAISTQQAAMALSQSKEEKEDLASRLKLYENHAPYRNDGGLAQLALTRLQDGKFAEAEGPARECLAIREKTMPDDWRVFNARSMLGGSLLGQQEYAEAEPLLLAGYAGLKQREDKIPSAGKARLPEAIQRLVQLYQATGRKDQAAPWQQKLAEFDPAGTTNQPAVPPP